MHGLAPALALGRRRVHPAPSREMRIQQDFEFTVGLDTLLAEDRSEEAG